VKKQTKVKSDTIASQKTNACKNHTFFRHKRKTGKWPTQKVTIFNQFLQPFPHELSKII